LGYCERVQEFVGKIEIRAYREGDASRIAQICYDTGFMGESASCYWRHQASFTRVWLASYIEREPQSLFVALYNGVVVGYLSGCVDSRDFPSVQQLRRRNALRYGLYLRPATAPYFWRLLRDAVSVHGDSGPVVDLSRWSSHLHMNLLPEARGLGVGCQLLETFFDYLKASGSTGCHLGTVAENTAAVAFFEKNGFSRLGQITPVHGLRDMQGRRLHKLLMVRDILGQDALAERQG
jgi:ribosomal protein S18 acetylase RimI-like enzyme